MGAVGDGECVGMCVEVGDEEDVDENGMWGVEEGEEEERVELEVEGEESAIGEEVIECEKSISGPPLGCVTGV
jgi:hypothetical protein